MIADPRVLHLLSSPKAKRRLLVHIDGSRVSRQLDLDSQLLYGVIQPEFGMAALCASSGNVTRMVLWMGARLLGIGLAVGLVASLALTRLISSQLWGVSPHDPVTLWGVVGVVATRDWRRAIFRPGGPHEWIQ